jgi:ABC-2 type transport system permease protein
MAQRLANFKSQGRLTYYASLPISKVAFILALIISRLGLTLVGMVVPLLVAPLIYNVQFDYNFWIVCILLLTAFALASIGLALGVLVSDPDLTGQLGNLLLILLLLASPLFIPSANLLLPFQIIGYLLPPTYAADALRLALTSDFSAGFYLDLGMLTILMLASFVLINQFLHWRLD